jgi:predicted RNase H-like HicB family nuclease
MNTEIIFVVEEAAEGGYTARALGASIFTEADTMETLRANVKEAVLTHFEEGEHPRIVRLHFVKEELLHV